MAATNAGVVRVDESKFDRIVTGLYAAATGDASWFDALAPVATAFGAEAALFHTFDASTGRVLQLTHSGPMRREAAVDYLRTWHLHDPRKSYLMAHSDVLMDRWWHCHETFDESFVARDPYYMQFLPAYRSRFIAVQLMSPGPGLASGFALELPAERGPLSADERHLAERLGHHAREALRQYERVRRLAAASLAGHTLLDAFAYPVWLLDEGRFIYYRNPAARDPTALGERTREHGGRLQLAFPAADRQLGVRLAELTSKPHGSRALVDARARSSDAICWLHLVKIEPIQALGAFGDRPLVMATLFAADRLTRLDPFALAEVFSLTPAQARVAVLIADGITADEIAARLGCAVPTVRTHIAHVMAKIGAKRMSDAVRLLRQGEALWATARN
jgi:DNA-binding CsgD family transcriptional regulator